MLLATRRSSSLQAITSLVLALHPHLEPTMASTLTSLGLSAGLATRTRARATKEVRRRVPMARRVLGESMVRRTSNTGDRQKLLKSYKKKPKTPKETKKFLVTMNTYKKEKTNNYNKTVAKVVQQPRK